MPKDNSRRRFLKTAGVISAGVAISGFPYYIRPSQAAENQLRFLGAENVTGNWDPTANTTLANILIERQAFDHSIFYPMIPGRDNMEVEHQLVVGIRSIDPYTSEYKLRAGIKFHDGTDFTAEDLKASIEYSTTPGRPRGVYPTKADVTVVDSHTVRVSTEAGNIPIDNALTLLHPLMGIMSAADIASKNMEKTINGTGPYRFVGQEGESTILEANPDYWGGKPKIDRFIYSFVPDSTTRVLSLLSGEAEMIERLESEQFKTLNDGGKFNVTTTTSVENKYLHFRCAKKPFDDVRLRQAAAHAIDRSVIREVMGIAGIEIESLLPRGKIGYSKLDLPKFDPAMCQKLLAEAGFPKGNGLPELEYITSTGFYPKTKEYGEVIQAMLQEQGFPIKLSVLETAAWNERIYNPQEGHLVDVGWAPSSPEPGVHLNLMWNNPPALITGLDDAEVNASIKEQLMATTLAKREKILVGKTMPLLAANIPSLPLFTSVMLHAMTKRLKGLHIYPDGSFSLKSASLS